MTNREDEVSYDNSNSLNLSRCKVVFVGDMSVGKTSIVMSFLGNKFTDLYSLTVGVDFFSKTIHYKNKTLKLQMWDSAGQEKYKSLIPSYVRGASIIFIIYDVSKKETFSSIKNWLEFIRNIKFDNSIIVLVGNKIDIDRQVPTSEGENFAKQENILFHEISAKTMMNVNKMFYNVISELSFFDQFKLDKKTIIYELEEENKEGKNKDKASQDINNFLNINNDNRLGNKCTKC